MSAECYPMSALPRQSRLYQDYLAMGSAEGLEPLASWYSAGPDSRRWLNPTNGGTATSQSTAHRKALAEALLEQGEQQGAGDKTYANIDKLRTGARAVVTGQQVGLFGGPLLTLLKAATAVARAREATAASGIEHVPIFWLATEDHDLAEVDQVSLPGKHGLETFSLGLPDERRAVGGVQLGAEVEPMLAQVCALLDDAPICDLLRSCYRAEATLASAFSRLMGTLFAESGLLVMDASTRVFHALGASTLRFAIEHAETLEEALLIRTRELQAAGYEAQVLVKKGASLLFLIDAETGQRTPLRRNTSGTWRAGDHELTKSDLLAILEQTPERISPNALLRPVFQDTILPTAAYVGGPAEIAYFAQSAVLFERILGHLTPVLPRLSATLIEPAVAALMERSETTLGSLFEASTSDVLTQRLGARAMPTEGKRLLANAGKAMDGELTLLTRYMGAMDASLGRSAMISASKMRYQMNRLRRMAASFQVQKETSLRKQAETMLLHLLPDGHPQERVLGGVWFLSRMDTGLIDRLVGEAGEMCLGHTVIRL